MVDVPGHPRLRAEFREHLHDARAIVFVVDASDISRNGPSVAEYARTFATSLHMLTDSRHLDTYIGFCMLFPPFHRHKPLLLYSY